MNDMQTIVREIRMYHGLNKNDFATLVGVSPAAITRWENGERKPTEPAMIGALLRVARPEQQAAILATLGIEDVEGFAADILASVRVQLRGVQN